MPRGSISKKSEMPVERWDPFRELAEFEDEIERWFEGVGRSLRRREQGAIWAPSVDIKETDKEIIVKADLPGMKKEDIEVSLDNNILTIKGEREFEKEEKEKDYVRVERSYGSFYRSFNIGVPVKEDEIKASYKDGVLEIVIPKAEVKEAKKVEIKAE
jgi:HSP20 family protein